MADAQYVQRLLHMGKVAERGCGVFSYARIMENNAEKRRKMEENNAFRRGHHKKTQKSTVLADFD